MNITINIDKNADLSKDIIFNVESNFWDKLYKDFDAAIDLIVKKACDKGDEHKKDYQTQFKATFNFDNGSLEYARVVARLNEAQRNQQAFGHRNDAARYFGGFQNSQGNCALYHGQQKATGNPFLGDAVSSAFHRLF